jgi:hypothetical protein
MSTNSVIEHRANYYYVMLREEYLAIVNGSHCKALILSVLEEWTNSKKAKGGSLYISMTYPQWCECLYGIYNRNCVIKALSELEAEKLISKQVQKIGHLKTYEYLLHIKEVNEKLKELPEKAPHLTRPLINAFKNKRVQNQTRLKEDGDSSSQGVLNGTADEFKKGRSIDCITQTINTDCITADENADEKIESDIDASANASASPTFFHPNFDFIAFDDFPTPTTLFLYLLPLPDWSNAESVLEYSEHEDKRREGATRDVVAALNEKGIHVKVIVRREKLGSVVDASQNKASTPQGILSDPIEEDLSTLSVENSVDKSNQQTVAPSLLPLMDIPDASPTPSSISSSKGKGRRRKNTQPLEDIPLTEEEQQALDESIQEIKHKEEAIMAKRNEIYIAIVAKRGFELQGKGPITNERKYAKFLAEEYTVVQVKAIHNYLFEKDKYWSDDERKYSIGAHRIWEQARKVAQILKDERIREEKKQEQKRLGISPLSEHSNRPDLKPIAVPKQEDRSWMSRRLDTRTGKIIEMGVQA